MDIRKLIKEKRGRRTQEEFGLLVWPNENPKRTRNRIAKYENGITIPPGDVLLRILAIKSGEDPA